MDVKNKLNALKFVNVGLLYNIDRKRSNLEVIWVARETLALPKTMERILLKQYFEKIIFGY